MKRQLAFSQCWKGDKFGERLGGAGREGTIGGGVSRNDIFLKISKPGEGEIKREGKTDSFDREGREPKADRHSYGGKKRKVLGHGCGPKVG